jgi:hypothetical protein
VSFVQRLGAFPEVPAMSDDWITLIPEDPNHVPDATRSHRAKARFAEIVPRAERIEMQLTDAVEFFNCGQNFERITCPSCRSDISVEWWQQRMDDDYERGFKLEKYATPCCNRQCSLHELFYTWPQGFGRFAIDAMNPNVGVLDDKYKQEMEEILGTPLRVIYQHL